MASIQVNADVAKKTLTVTISIKDEVTTDVYEFDTEEETIAAAAQALQIVSAEVVSK